MSALVNRNKSKSISTKIKMITKPWGWERWMAYGPAFGYVLKELYIKKGRRLSLQFHQFKQETSVVQKGKGILYYSSQAVNPKKFIDSKYSAQEIQ